SPKDHNIIFEPFTQSQTGMKHSDGTGLGLPICREYTRLLGGELFLESNLGEGSKFFLTIPVTQINENKISDTFIESQVIALETAQEKTRILVVEDEEDNRQLLLQTLSDITDEFGESCLEINSASNGQEAVEIWKELSPQLIFMDMRMPVMDGFEATRQIKNHHNGKNTIIIALTASAFEEDRTLMLENGCDDLIIKPYQEIDLFKSLEKYLGVRFVYEEPLNYQNNNRLDSNLASLEATTINVDPLQLNDELLAAKLNCLSKEQLLELKYIMTTFNTNAIIEFSNLIIDFDPELSNYLKTSALQYEYRVILNALESILD
nr:response regulator [Anaerolineaceae bacterium]